jgi:hypothetical protein
VIEPVLWPSRSVAVLTARPARSRPAFDKVDS